MLHSPRFHVDHHRDRQPKGDVAKNTTWLNLSHALSERDRRVLLVDLDPQASLTISLGFDVRELKATIYDVLLATNPDLSTKGIIQATGIKGVSLALLPLTLLLTLELSSSLLVAGC